MRSAVSPLVCPDIPEDLTRYGRVRRLTRTLAPPRDSAEYRWGFRPADHTEAGLLIGGPDAESCTLAELVYFTFCRISASTPENERLQYVRYKGRKAGLDAEELPEYSPFCAPRHVTNGGRFRRPVKPANSGRKRKAA